MTTYLKFDTQADCVAAFAPYLVTDQTGDSHMPFYIGMSAVDVVGVIQKPTGAYTGDADGLRTPVLTPLAGWHVNLSCLPEDCPSDLRQYIIDAPTTPSRVFA
jgi:hypothetical protein